VEASDQPLSVIIIGIGAADFGIMETLDADKDPLFSSISRKFQSRDMVQFVPFSRFKNDPSLLAKEVLKEIPQ
jgi:hypothetical protein